MLEENYRSEIVEFDYTCENPLPKNSENLKPVKRSFIDPVSGEAPLKQKKIDAFYQKKVQPVLIDREAFINGIVCMIVNGRPLSIMEDEGFLQIVQPILATFSLRLNHYNVYDFVHECYLQMRRTLQTLIKNRDHL